MHHTDIDAHEKLAQTPSWGSDQGRNGDEYRPPMKRGDLGLVVALWAGSWLLIVLCGAVIGFVAQAF